MKQNGADGEGRRMAAEEVKAGGHVKEIGWRRMDESKRSSVSDNERKKEKTRRITEKKRSRKKCKIKEDTFLFRELSLKMGY